MILIKNFALEWAVTSVRKICQSKYSLKESKVVILLFVYAPRMFMLLKRKYMRERSL